MIGRHRSAGAARVLAHAELEQPLRRSLAARAAAVRAEPDLADLELRIAASEQERPARRSPPARLAAAAAVVVAAAVAGGTLGATLVPSRTQHALLSSQGGNQGGPLPSGPGGSASSHAPARVAGPAVGPSALPGSSLGLLPSAQAFGGLFRGASRFVIARRTSGGVETSVSVAPLPAVAVSSASGEGCYAGELVVTRAQIGAVAAHSVGAAGLPALGPDGLEVVSSGSRPLSSGSDLWWATVAVGSGAARVAAEQPNGITDAATPVTGLAVVAGVVPGAEASGFFSVVAEASSGQPLHSLGFLAGGAPRLVGSDPAQSGSLSRGVAPACSQAGRRGARGLRASARRGAGASPAALLAAGSVVAAIEEAHPPTSGGVPVVVQAVRLLSPGRAEVLYQLADGRLRTAAAAGGRAGTWTLPG